MTVNNIYFFEHHCCAILFLFNEIIYSYYFENIQFWNFSPCVFLFPAYYLSVFASFFYTFSNIWWQTTSFLLKVGTQNLHENSVHTSWACSLYFSLFGDLSGLFPWGTHDINIFALSLEVDSFFREDYPPILSRWHIPEYHISRNWVGGKSWIYNTCVFL